MSAVPFSMSRPAEGRIVLGVCAAIARRTEVDVTLVRIIAAIGLAVLTTPFLVAYAAFALVAPRDDGRMLLDGKPRDRAEWLLGWAVVIIAATLLISSPSLLGLGDGPDLLELAVFVAAVSLVAVALSRRGERIEPAPVGPTATASAFAEPPAVEAPTEPLRSPGEGAGGATEERLPPLPPPPGQPGSPGSGGGREPKGPSVFIPALGAITAAVGVGAVVVAAFDLELTGTAVAVAAGLIAVVCGIAAITSQGRAGTVPLLLCGALFGLTAVGAAATADEFERGVGVIEAAPVTVPEVERGYERGVGFIEVDLRELELPPGRTTMPLYIGLGAAEVIVPRDLVVIPAGDGLSGDVAVEGEGAESLADSVPPADQVAPSRSGRSGAKGNRAGSGRSQDALPPPVLEIDAEIGTGAVEITRRDR